MKMSSVARGLTKHRLQLFAATLASAWCLQACASRTASPPPPAAVVAKPTPASPAAAEPTFDELLERVAHIPAPPPPSPYTPAEALSVDTADVPAFALLDFDPSRLHQRAWVGTPKLAYTPRGLTVVAKPRRPRLVSRVYAVLDPDDGATSRRPRLLCEHDGPYRIGVAFDVDDLETVITTPSLLQPSSSPVSEGETTPGVALAPGVRVMALDSEGSMTRVQLERGKLTAEGYVATEQLGAVFSSATQPLVEWTDNATLIRPIEFRASPGGAVFARSAPQHRNTARRFGSEHDGYVLIGYEVDASVVTTGWVDAVAVARGLPYPLPGGAQVVTGVLCGVAAGGRAQPEPRYVKLTRGTLLRTVGSNEVVGVVTFDHQAECRRGCNTPTPRVRPGGCGVDLTLKATPATSVAE